MKSNGIITDQDHIKLHHGDHDGTSSDLLPAGMSSIRIPVHGTGTWYQVPSTRYVSGVAGTGTWYQVPPTGSTPEFGIPASCGHFAEIDDVT